MGRLLSNNEAATLTRLGVRAVLDLTAEFSEAQTIPHPKPIAIFLFLI
jgi:hypothetical protein